MGLYSDNRYPPVEYVPSERSDSDHDEKKEVHAVMSIGRRLRGIEICVCQISLFVVSFLFMLYCCC